MSDMDRIIVFDDEISQQGTPGFSRDQAKRQQEQ